MENGLGAVLLIKNSSRWVLRVQGFGIMEKKVETLGPLKVV